MSPGFNKTDFFSYLESRFSPLFFFWDMKRKQDPSDRSLSNKPWISGPTTPTRKDCINSGGKAVLELGTLGETPKSHQLGCTFVGESGWADIGHAYNIHFPSQRAAIGALEKKNLRFLSLWMWSCFFKNIIKCGAAVLILIFIFKIA